MSRLETREIAYFIAVAEERHFGRAADRLGIAQPPLSRAIKQLERRLGVPLLDRTSREIRLTAAGEALLHGGRKALEAVEAAARRSQRAGQPEPSLVLATKPGGDSGLLPEILRRYESTVDAVRVELVVCGIGEQATLLRDGRADVAFLHRPYDDVSGFDTEDLVIENQVAVLPVSHRLAARTRLLLTDLADEVFPRWPGMSAGDAAGPLVRDAGQLLALIALGKVVAVLPESVRPQLGTDVVAVPVADAEPTTTTLAWPERSHSRAIATLVRTATEVAHARNPARPVRVTTN